MRIASPRSARRYFASILTLIFRGVLSPLAPVSHAVARRSAPATAAVVEYAVSLVVQDVRLNELQPTVRRNIPVRSISQPRKAITVLQLTTGSGSVADASKVALTQFGLGVLEVKTSRA
jgi:hypothetical protein